jgi:hypothetical protein
MNSFIEIPANNISIAKRKLKYGVGINDAAYNVQLKLSSQVLTCPFYRSWCDMLKRCYDKAHILKNPSYETCEVHFSWYRFSSFRNWMETQDWVGKELDKDILVEGNKVYSPNTCIFVAKNINSLLVFSNSIRGKYLLGVDKRPTQASYTASCCNGVGKKVHLGSFKTEQEAHQAYCTYKANLITEIANQQTDLRLKNALLRRAETIHLVA